MYTSKHPSYILLDITAIERTFELLTIKVCYCLMNTVVNKSVHTCRHTCIVIIYLSGFFLLCFQTCFKRESSAYAHPY